MKRTRGMAAGRDMVKYPILLICCFMLVIACASKRPPVATPPESRQKASQRPYTVFGERYEPLQTHAGFVQTGIASWYGDDFHGKKTSNGETYDMHAMTAAHKTLPLGVFVRVRNTANRNEAIVRVNDRGAVCKRKDHRSLLFSSQGARSCYCGNSAGEDRGAGVQGKRPGSV
ncbi:MAG: septal ring lytic transglycosylase RlpA family protein [Deltaproteobacteria bacterium]